MLARHVSDLTGPSSGAFCTSCICRLWYVVTLCVLLDMSSRYKITRKISDVSNIKRILFYKHIFILSISKYAIEHQHTRTYTKRVGSAHPQNLQRDSSAMDITVGGDFLGLCHQQSSYQHGSYYQWLWGLDVL